MSASKSRSGSASGPSSPTLGGKARNMFSSFSRSGTPSRKGSLNYYERPMCGSKDSKETEHAPEALCAYAKHYKAGSKENHVDEKGNYRGGEVIFCVKCHHYRCLVAACPCKQGTLVSTPQPRDTDEHNGYLSSSYEDCTLSLVDWTHCQWQGTGAGAVQVSSCCTVQSIMNPNHYSVKFQLLSLSFPSSA